MIYNLAGIAPKVINQHSYSFYYLALEPYRSLIFQTTAAFCWRYIPIFVL
jgi:hypothetical protein